jgi:hypothetical protein
MRSDVLEQILTRLLLLEPEVIAENLEEGVKRGLFASAPSRWQLAQGVLRMLHRMATRPESVGLSIDSAPRRELGARLMRFRLVRGPLLLAIGAVRPWDLTGLLSGRDGLIRHLVGTHHDRRQFGYDLEILRLYAGGLEALRDEAEAIVAGTHKRAALLRASCVYEGYHERLLKAARMALESGGDVGLAPDERTDPDLSFEAFLAWCAARPDTLRGAVASWSRAA